MSDISEAAHPQHGDSAFIAVTQWGWGILRALFKFGRAKPLGAAGGAVLFLFILIAIFAPLVATDGPLTRDTAARLHGPSFAHVMGTDLLGRDVFSRVVYGARISLYVGLLSVVIATTAGTLLGVSSAYFGGWYDLVLQRLVDTLLGFPLLILAIMIMTVFGASTNNVVLAIGVTMAAPMTRIARSAALSIRAEEYITAARALGASHPRILFHHLTINSLAPVIVMATGYLGTAIVTESSLSFLGLGVPPPNPSWGGMLQVGVRGYAAVAPWLMIFPGIALSLVVFSFNLLGDAVRDTMDPRLHGH